MYILKLDKKGRENLMYTIGHLEICTMINGHTPRES